MGSKSVGNVPTATTTVTASLQPSINISVRSTVTRFSSATYAYSALTTRTDTITNPTVTDTFSSTPTLLQTTSVVVPSTITKTSTFTQTDMSTSTTKTATTQGSATIEIPSTQTISSAEFLMIRTMATLQRSERPLMEFWLLPTPPAWTVRVSSLTLMDDS